MARQTKRKRTRAANAANARRCRQEVMNPQLPSLARDMCYNCRRVFENESLQTVRIDFRPLARKFCLIDRDLFHQYKDRNGVAEFPVCGHCRQYIKHSDPAVASLCIEIIWPAFFWYLLSSDGVFKKVGLNIWSIIPKEWRKWWLLSFQNQPHATCAQATLEFPKSVVRDATKMRKFAADLIGTKKLFEWKKHMCDVLECKACCPYGCSEFIHKACPFEMDIVIAQCLDLTDKDMLFYTKEPARKMRVRARGMRKDFFSFPLNHDVGCLYNPAEEAQVLPTICFEQGAPHFMVCVEHEKGSSTDYIHHPRNPFPFPANPKGDQVSPVSIKSRLVKSGKASKYSNTYQMLELQGHTNGIDCVRVSCESDFSMESQMSVPYENLMVNFRDDMQAYVSSFAVANNGILEETGEFILQNAAQSEGSLTAVVGDCYEGATMMTAETALMIEEETTNFKKPCVEIVNEQDPEKTETRHFTPVWTRLMTYVHPYTSYGSPFAPIFKTSSKKYSVALGTCWKLFAVVCVVDVLWMQLSKRELYSTKDIEGTLLTTASKCCFPEKSGKRGSKYCFENFSKYSQISGGTMNEDGAQKMMKAFADRSATTFGEILELVFSNSEAVFEYDCSQVTNTVQELRGMFDEDVPSCSEVTILYDIPLSSGFSSMLELCNDDGSNWELRCAVLREISPDATTSDDLHCIARHGQQFDRFWHINNRSDFVEKVIDVSDPKIEAMCVDVAVFVRQNDGKDDSRRERFLKCMGGQCDVYCERHEKPIIVNSRPKRKTAMDGNAMGGDEDEELQENMHCCFVNSGNSTEKPCSGIITYCCPEKNCAVCLCSVHMKEARVKSKSEGCRAMLVAPSIAGGGERSLSAQQEVFVETVDEDEESDQDREWEISWGVRRENSGEEDDDWGDDDDDSDVYVEEDGETDRSRCEGDEGEDFVQIPPLDFDHLYDENGSFDHEHAPDIDDPDNIENHGVLQGMFSTVASTMKPAKVFLKDTVRSISGSVILNHCGTLLARGYRKLRASTWQLNFIQRIVSNTPGRSVPLLYAEGSLFPSLFWKDDGNCGIVGAIPTALLASDQTLRTYGIASIPKHMRSRIKSIGHSSIAEHQDYLCYAFDCMANLSCRGEDTRLVLRRGMPEANASLKKVDDSMMFDSESIERRPHVNQLCAKMREEGATYFGSHSVNQKDHFGLKKLKRWIDSRELREIVSENLQKAGAVPSLQLESDIEKAILQASTVTMLRHWMEVADLYMDYICNSPEKPLGKVNQAWWRHEYQDSAGNLSHLHFLLWIDRTEEDLGTTLDRIRGQTLDLITPEEFEQYVREGLDLQDENGDDMFLSLQVIADSVLSHICSSRCMKRVGKDGELTCRVPHMGLESPDFTRHVNHTVPIKHSEACQQTLRDIGLLKRDEYGHDVYDERLRAYKHYPPTHPGCGKFSPCNGRLFAATRSNQNLTFVTGYFSNRYVAKYTAKVDQSNRVYFGAGQREANSVNIDLQFLHNTKITGSAMNEKLVHESRNDKDHPTGRAISIMEMLAVSLGYGMVKTNIQFIHVPTKPLGERCGVQKPPKVCPKKDNPLTRRPCDISDGAVPVYQVRNLKLRGDPERLLIGSWRALSNSEAIILKDSTMSNVSLDMITIFGLRPCELRFVRKVELYYKWFYRETKSSMPNASSSLQLKYAEEHIRENIRASSWIDGLGHRVFVRPQAIPEILAYLNEKGESDIDFYSLDDPNLQHAARSDMAWKITSRLFTDLKRASEASWDTLHMWQKDLYHRFVADGGNRVCSTPVVWYDPIPPTQGHRFLIHILLSMGEFDNEMNLMCSPTLKSAFLKAKLVFEDDDDPDVLLASCDLLVQRYILEQLVYQPSGTKTFDRYVVAARQVIRDAIVYDRLPARDMPACLFTQLCKMSENENSAYVEKAQSTLLKTTVANLQAKGMDQLDDNTVRQISNATRQHPAESFTMELQKGDGQSDESFVEQKEVLEVAKSKFDAYETPAGNLTKGLVINGGPGTGKTTLMEVQTLYAISRGLCCALTTVMSERACQLGGIHISRMFAIPVREKTSPGRIAEMAYIDLLKNPERLALLRKLDVLFIDEFGQVSSELLSVMDMVMRRVRQNSQFMGGLLLIGTYDYLQLPPVKGHPPLLSPHMLTCFTLLSLKHSVRAGKDKHLREIQDMTRLDPRAFQSRRQDFIEKIKKHCTFVKSFDDDAVKRNMLRMFGTKAATSKAMQNLLGQMKRKYGDDIVCSTAQDFESSIEGVFVDATTATTKMLNREVKEPQTLLFYPGAVYEITYNLKGVFNQTQLAVLRTVPTPNDISTRKQIAVYLAPPGCKSVPEDVNETTLERLVNNHGWTETSVGFCPDNRQQTFRNGIQAKRLQYGLRPRIASTIHSGMGQDLPAVVTKVAPKSEEKGAYHLWSKEQVIVLLSRTHYAKNIIFVGEPEKTATCLADCLEKVSQYTDYMTHLMESLTGTDAPQERSFVNPFRHFPYRMCDYVIPTHNASYCYLLVSLGEPTRTTCYIGETHNLVLRYHQHCSGTGAMQTSNPLLHPWGLIGFVVGFERQDGADRKNFESSWRKRRDLLQRMYGRKLSSSELGDAARDLIREECDYRHLTYVKVGHVTPS